MNTIPRLRMLFATLAVFAILPSTAQDNVWNGGGRWGDQGDGTYRNPVLPADFSDLDCIRVGDTYYAISSTLQYSPGMTILASKDLVNWDYAGHAVADLRQIGPELNWDRMNRPGRGVWAGAIRHHAGRFHVYFGTPDEGYFMTSAPQPQGPWEPLTQLMKSSGWDDCCPFWDDDGQAWFIGTRFAPDPVTGKKYNIHLWRMTPDGKALVEGSDQILYQAQGSEANKLFKVGDTYHHYFSEVRNGERVPMMGRAKSITGPYEYRQLTDVDPRLDREPNQGGIIDDPAGNWWFFTHHGTGGWEGRAASLMPVTWTEGWPVPGKIGADGLGRIEWSGRKPAGGGAPATPRTSDDFSSDTLGPQWQWHYQPRAEKWSLTERPGFLRLHAFKPLAGDDLYKVGNLLSQRAWCAPDNRVTVRMEIAGMADGQQAGLVVHTAAVQGGVGVRMEKGIRSFFFRRGGKYQAGPEVAGDAVWLRMEWGLDGECRFAVGEDGRTFAPLGEAVAFPRPYSQYRGGRIGIYTCNPAGESGHVDVDRVDYPLTSGR
ncbi:MAG: glycoside hydrolase 43 family protein [Kiritimatiellia bacterium]